jgi:tetratricopeptide (TPR) repeat protein
LHSENVRDLQQAASLDSFDSPLQMRLAHRELEEGHPQQAESAWRKAIQSNPADPAPQQELLRFLVEQNRFDEAYNLSDAYLNYFPKDAKLWMDHGLLALRWNRAIAIDPSQMLAHMYLASELDHEGKAQSAAGHYKVALSRIAEQPPAKRPAPEQVIAIVLRMADCQARASRTDEAVHSYELAARLASQTKQARLESIADVNEAAIQADAGKLDEALPLYQNALQLDDSIGDQSSSAEDWLAYGRFLEKAGFPDRLVYACFEKSASLQDSLAEASQRQYLTDARNKAERRLGPAAVAIRRDPTPTLQQALALRR